MRKFYLVMILTFAAITSSSAQHTFGLFGGNGSGAIRAYPAITTKSVYGCATAGVTWRHYTAERFLGGFGIDLEFVQRGFAYAPYTSTNNNDGDNYGKELLYYTRNINSIMMPIVWQPHVYMFNKHVRVYAEAALNFSYDLSSTYYDALTESYGTVTNFKGDYNYRTERDNRWGYGLAGGAGITYLAGRYEFSASARYYFGYSDVVKNRTKYYNKGDDNFENPFTYTPIRSPLDNVMFRLGVSYRFNKKGYDEWDNMPIKRVKGLGKGFGYDGKK